MFYTITNWTTSEESIQATLLIDPEHPLFKGHFPNMPILPGACMVQLTHHLVDKHLQKATRFVKAGQIKFLIPVNPLQEPELTANLKLTLLQDGTYRAEQSLTNGEKTFFKFSGIYQSN